MLCSFSLWYSGVGFFIDAEYIFMRNEVFNEKRYNSNHYLQEIFTEYNELFNAYSTFIIYYHLSFIII